MPVGEAGGSFERSLINLGGDISDPFKVFDDVKLLYKEVLAEKREKAANWKKKKNEWTSKNSGQDKKLQMFYSGSIPEIDFKGIQGKFSHKSCICNRSWYSRLKDRKYGSGICRPVKF
jgi:transketolase